MNQVLSKGMTGFIICSLILTVAACRSSINGPALQSPLSVEHRENALTEQQVKIVSLQANAQYERGSEAERNVHRRILEKTGVDLQLETSTTNADYGQMIDRMLSSDEQLDIIPLIRMDEAIKLYNNGAIIPLNGLLDEYGPNLKANIKPEMWSQASADGQIIGIPSQATNTTGNVIQIRTDWLQELNLKKPVTIADFEYVMEAFKQNKEDAYPLSTGFATFNALHVGFTPYFLPQASEWWLDGQGRLFPPEFHPGYKRFLSKMVEWNAKGYIWPEMILSTPPKQTELIAQNKAGAVAGWYSSTIAGATEVLIKTVPEANYDPLILQGDGINKIPASQDTQYVTVITKKSKHPEAVMRFLDYHASREGYELVYIGIEGESYTRLPDGTLEYIGENKDDSYKANYYALYWMFQMDFDDFPTWPMSSWIDRKFTAMRQKTKELPSFQPIDYRVTYDKSQWESFAYLTELDLFMEDQKMKVFTGERPVSDWDNIIQQWQDMGGKQMIEDRNRQYQKALHK